MSMYSISFLNCLSRLFSEAYAMEPAANVTIVSPKASIYVLYLHTVKIFIFFK